MNEQVMARTWQHLTRAQRTARHMIYLLMVAATIWSLQTVEIIPEFLMDAPTQIFDLFNRMWPPDYQYYPQTVHQALIETINIATLGTLLTLLAAIPLALLNAPNVTSSSILIGIAQFFLVASRSVNSLIWALLFIALFGPGVLAGILAVAVRSVGFVGKMLSEAIAEINMGTIEALRATGASWLSIMFKGYWPQVMPAFYSILLLRWDINVRESAVLGLVGAGGIGVVLNDAINLFQWQRVSTVLISIFVVVILAEILVVKIRKKLI